MVAALFALVALKRPVAKNLRLEAAATPVAAAVLITQFVYARVVLLVKIMKPPSSFCEVESQTRSDCRRITPVAEFTAIAPEVTILMSPVNVVRSVLTELYQ